MRYNLNKLKEGGNPMTIKIDNPEIEQFFVNEFKSDIKKFSEFILTNLEKYKQQKEFDITPLDPAKTLIN